MTDKDDNDQSPRVGTQDPWTRAATGEWQRENRRLNWSRRPPTRSLTTSSFLLLRVG